MKRIAGVLLLLACCVAPMTAHAVGAIILFDGGSGASVTDAVRPGGWPKGWARLVVD